MKKIILFILLVVLYQNASSQKIQYSKDAFQVNDPQEMQFVANISGYHHLLKFSPNKKAYAYIYNPKLQLEQKRDLGFLVKEECTIKLLAFADFYYVYIHGLRPSTHDIWKIDKLGNVTSLSKKFRQVIDSFLKNYEATIQLTNQDGSFYLLGNTYYDTIKTLKTTIVKLDDQLNSTEAQRVLYPFDKDYETLQQTELAKNVLLVLKTSKNREVGNPLDLTKIDLLSGKSVSNSFSSASLMHGSPAFILDRKDSSIIIYSLATERKNVFGAERPVFISRLNYSLQELTPVTLLRSQFTNNTAVNYLLLKGTPSTWIKMGKPSMNLNARLNPLTAVRLTLLDEQFNTTADTLIANKKIFDVQPLPFARFSMNKQACLFLVQNLTKKRKGLLMVTATETGHLLTNDIRVFDKYDCVLSQMQLADDYVICPYLYRNEMGLIKIIMN